MPSLSDFLHRVRPVATPGPAAPAGVPVDRRALLTAELAPVFRALRDAQHQAEQIVAEAQREAERRRTAAAAEMAAVLAEARQRADEARTSAAAGAAAASEAEHDELTERARRDADEIRRRAVAEMPALIERVVAAVESTGSVHAP